MQSVYGFTDPVDFISAYLNHRKSLNPDFSIRKYSNSLNLSSSAQLIDVLQKKKKLKDKLAKLITAEMNIDPSEKMYFEAMLGKSQTDSSEKKKLFDLIMRELSPVQDKGSFSKCYANDLDIFSHWVYMAILSLSEIPNFKMSVSNIKKRLKYDLDEFKIESALAKLLKEDFLYIDDNNFVKKRYSRTTTKSDCKNDSAHKYYEIVCELAKKAISVDVEYREYNTFSFPISENDIPLAKEIIRKCRNQLSKLSENKDVNQVYQASLMLFPLTNIKNNKENEADARH
jgi:uncharacterized protein (TIGR02147 family)